MRIVSINIGQPRPMTVRGKEVSTGIYKAAVPGQHRIESSGIVGDARVEPRKLGESHHAISVYPCEHYAHWSCLLGQEGWPFGQFGENLTVEGALESDVRIGDVLRCGDAVLQVAQPRIPCRKLDARMGVAFASRFLASRRTGYYLRVLEAGHVAEGNVIELLARDPASPTVDEFVRASQLDYWDAAALEGLLRAKDLMPAWREILQDKIDRARAATGWFVLRELEVIHREEECDDVTSFVVRCPSGRPLPSFRAGQSLIVATPSDVHRVVRRAYAISSSPGDTTTYRITILRRRAASDSLPPGQVSSYLHERIHVGQRLRFTEPSGGFVLDVGRERPAGILFLCEGIGIAPVVSMLHEWAQVMRDVPARLCHTVKNGRSHALRDEVRAIAEVTGSLRVDVAYSEPRPEEVLGRDYDFRGPLSAQYLGEAARTPRLDVYVSGWNGFVESTLGQLRALGIDASRIRAERFGR
jgi:MOSC domain-containing protein YiiM/ferredoxin-NADP reductase